MDTLVDKAWNLHRLTGRVPIETILTATAWLEERHRKAPSDQIAVAIALHYVLLALREDATLESQLAQDYCARAAHWQVVAPGKTNGPAHRQNHWPTTINFGDCEKGALNQQPAK